MGICKLTIITSVNGERTQIIRMGKVEYVSNGIEIRYREENARIVLILREDEVVIRREGDYLLSLLLRDGETTEGEIGMSGSSGSMPVQTYLLQRTIQEKKIELDLGYRLLFGADAQDMRLQVTALSRGGKV